MTQVTFRLDPMHPAGLIRVDGSASTAKAVQPVLQFDPRDGSACLSCRHESEQGSMLRAVYNRLVLEWDIPRLADAEWFSKAINAGVLDPLLTRIRDGFSHAWDGNNNVGRYSEDAAAAISEVDDWLDGLPTLDEPAGLWEAGDWLQSDPPTVRADMTDEELEALAAKLDAEALADNVVLADTFEYLKRLRDRA